MSRRRVAAVAGLALAGSLLAGGAQADGFRALAHRLGRLPQVHRVHVPFLSLAARLGGAGADGVAEVRMALYEVEEGARPPLAALAAELLGPGWKPCLRVRSRGEETVMLARREGDRVRLVLVSRDEEDLVLLAATVRPRVFVASLEERRLADG